MLCTLLKAVIFLLGIVCATSQLTFSPDWGKRSAASGTFFESQSSNCKTANEMLLEIFHFVQSEAQLFLDCRHRE